MIRGSPVGLTGGIMFWWTAPAPGIAMCHSGCRLCATMRVPSAMQPTIIGLDLAKHVFQVHGVAADGQVMLRRQVRRSELLKFFRALPPCLVGMEASRVRTTGHAS